MSIAKPSIPEIDVREVGHSTAGAMLAFIEPATNPEGEGKLADRRVSYLTDCERSSFTTTWYDSKLRIQCVMGFTPYSPSTPQVEKVDPLKEPPHRHIAFPSSLIKSRRDTPSHTTNSLAAARAHTRRLTGSTLPRIKSLASLPLARQVESIESAEDSHVATTVITTPASSLEPARTTGAVLPDYASTPAQAHGGAGSREEDISLRRSIPVKVHTKHELSSDNPESLGKPKTSGAPQRTGYRRQRAAAICSEEEFIEEIGYLPIDNTRAPLPTATAEAPSLHTLSSREASYATELKQTSTKPDTSSLRTEMYAEGKSEETHPLLREKEPRVDLVSCRAEPSLPSHEENPHRYSLPKTTGKRVDTRGLKDITSTTVRVSHSVNEAIGLRLSTPKQPRDERRLSDTSSYFPDILTTKPRKAPFTPLSTIDELHETTPLPPLLSSSRTAEDFASSLLPHTRFRASTPSLADSIRARHSRSETSGLLAATLYAQRVTRVSREEIRAKSASSESRLAATLMTRSSFIAIPLSTAKARDLVDWTSLRYIECLRGKLLTTVWRVVDPESGKSYAYKILSLGNAITRAQREHLIQAEIMFGTVFKHPALLQVHQSRRKSSSYELLMELGPRSKLITHVGKLTSPQVKYIAAQLVHLLSFLQEHKILHCDLSLSNILVNSKCRIKVIGMSAATLLTSSPHTVCPEHYTASSSPEYIATSHVSLATQWWQLGTLLYQLEQGERHACLSSPRASIPGSRNLLLIDLIQKISDRNPNKRPSIKAIVDHPYFEGTFWDLLFSDGGKS